MWMRHQWLDLKAASGRLWLPLKGDLLSLKGVPREFWFANIISYLEYFSLFALQAGLVLYVTSEFGIKDSEAGWMFGKVYMLLSLFGIAIGTVIDRLGVKRSLIAGTALLLVGRAIVTFTHSTELLKATLYTIIPIGMAFVIVALPIGIKRYTNDSNRSFGFTFLYVMRNIAAATAYPLIDWFGRAYSDGFELTFWGLSDGIHLSAYRLLLYSTIFTTLVTLIFATRCREIEIKESTAKPFEPRKIAVWKNVKEVLVTKQAWVFVLFMVCMLFVRMTHKVHVNATFPKYLIREVGEGVLFGTVLSINPIMIIFLAPLIVPLVKRMSLVNSILLGTLISGVSAFWLTLGAAYETAIIFVVVLTLGEAIWGPRLKEFMATVAPKGKEGTYIALAAIPFALAKWLAGGFSGYMLATHCPESGLRNSELMWFIIALITLLTPVLIFAFRKIFNREKFN